MKEDFTIYMNKAVVRWLLIQWHNCNKCDL